jgi:hypothetical protein
MLSFFKDKKGKVIIWQTPNWAIGGWAVFLLANKFADGQAQIVLSFISTAFLTIWACMEIIGGASYFRRTLGVAILVFTIYSRLT